MKKVLLGLFALSAVAMAENYFEGTNLYLKAGVDVWQDYETVSYYGETVTNDEADSLGYEIGVEVTREVLPNFELGLGLSYQDHGDTKYKKLSPYTVDESDYDDIINAEFGPDTTFDGVSSEEVKVGSYKSIPLYITGKYNIPLESNVKPYIKADLGYSFNFDETDTKYRDNVSGKINGTTPVAATLSETFNTSIDNGMYYGIGAGAEYNNFMVELMYKVNKADVEVTVGNEKISGDLDYSRVTLSFGYKFNF